MAQGQGPGALRRAWYQWRMKRFPWRKKWLVGFDLHGNTFWEFKDALHSMRNRRIAQYSRSTHYGDVKVSPAWMQWLRHTRFDPPSLAEQKQDLMRQERMKVLAAQADARWASQPSALDPPDVQQPMQMLQSRDPEMGIAAQDVQERSPASPLLQDKAAEPQEGIVQPQVQKSVKKEPKNSPWKQAQQSSPGEAWQPQGWSPAPAKRNA